MSIIWHGILTVVIDVINLLIRGIGSSLGSALSILPDMPEIPNPPTQVTNVEGWIAWVFPMQQLVDMLTFASTMFFIWWVASIALRWAKAERGSA